MRRQLLSLADSPLRRWAEEVQNLAELVAENYDDDEMRRSFIDLSMQLHVEQPLKTPFLAAVILVANVKKQELAGEVLARLATETEGAIQKGEWRTVKLHLKLLACLQSLLEDEGIFPLLDELFSRAADLQTASSEDTIGTEIVKIILLTIPYILVASPGQLSQQKAAELMEKTDIIASEPHALQAIVDPFHPETQEQNPGKSQSLCMLLQNQLQAEAAKDWELKCLPRPWQMPLEDIELQEKLSTPPKHALPTVNIPTTVIAGPRALFPEMYLSVYADQDAESVPPLTSISSSLIRDGLVDTINILNFNRNVVARYLLDIDSYFADGTFVKRATAFDDLRNFPADRSTWKPEDVAVDTVFSQLFALPHPECKLVYYHSILTEACKLAPAAIAPSLGRAIRYLYRNNPRMDLELSYRFVDWFSHHLSNFGFTWKWAEWADDTSLPAMHPSIWFLEGALDKEIRLSFAQRIQKTVPDPYQALIGPEKEQDVPPFKFANPDVPFSKEGQEIGQLLRRKAADDEIAPVILSIQAQANSQNLDPYVTCTDVFMTAVCWVGSKSLSHVLACIDRTKARLLELSNASEASRMQVVTAVMSYWHAHPGVAISIIEKLLNYSVITPIAVINWALQGNESTSGASGGEALAKAHVFEIVSNTVAKVTNRVRQLYASDEADDEARAKEAQAMKDMFRTMNDTLTSWANGNKDQMIETGDGSSDREAMIQRWGQRWLRVFQRKAALEEAFLLEAAKGKDSMVVENGAGGQ
ncbi:MIF4G like-domain-containing protein [Emericellopsis atlantica]|uniref:MIF4G like-domain-containing protein n=1 Tax=Emericellopsis atlantica TaxID=2614577 RepID=A0A9P8CKZ9_9HYPO|nr:MIF4G like-domain-containing protein [Emericellopsis atlantica]KAG9250873.1 MIF4G like-domain-containing protein [Emericellopsis atlantica]